MIRAELAVAFVLAFISCDPAFAQMVLRDDFPRAVTFVSDVDPLHAAFDYDFRAFEGLWFPVESSPVQVVHVCFEQPVEIPAAEGLLRQTKTDLRTGDVVETIIMVPEPSTSSGLVVGLLVLAACACARRPHAHALVGRLLAASKNASD